MIAIAVLAETLAVLIIAHRLHAVRRAVRIPVVGQGEICDQGIMMIYLAPTSS